MKKISSFCVDHTRLEKGMYISRIDGDITTYDIRLKKPNGGDYLDYAAVHTIEHLFATFARNSKHGDNIVYVGPMGCRTGFYLLTKGLCDNDAISLVYDAFCFIRDYDGEIPGNSAVECGNYKEHDLKKSKVYAKEYTEVIKDWNSSKLHYVS